MKAQYENTDERPVEHSDGSHEYSRRGFVKTVGKTLGLAALGMGLSLAGANLRKAEAACCADNCTGVCIAECTSGCDYICSANCIGNCAGSCTEVCRDNCVTGCTGMVKFAP